MNNRINKIPNRFYTKGPENSSIEQSLNSKNEFKSDTNSLGEEAMNNLNKRSIEANAEVDKMKSQINRQKLSPAIIKFLDPENSNRDIDYLIKDKISTHTEIDLLIKLVFELNKLDESTLQHNIPVLDFVLSDHSFCKEIKSHFKNSKGKFPGLNIFSRQPILKSCEKKLGVDFVNDLKLCREMKLLGLKTGLDIKFGSNNKDYVERCTLWCTFHDAIESLEEFQTQYEKENQRESIDSAINCLKTGFDLIADRPAVRADAVKAPFKKAIEAETPILLDAPQVFRHNVNILIKNGYLAFCNRGAGVRRSSTKFGEKNHIGIELYKFDPKTVTDQLVEAILNGDVNQIVNNLQEKSIVGGYKASRQSDLNCTYASVKMGVLASFMVDELIRKNISRGTKPYVLNEVCHEAVKLYKDWSLYLRMDAVKKYPEESQELEYGQLKTAKHFIRHQGPLAFMQAVKSGHLWNKNAYDDHFIDIEDGKIKGLSRDELNNILSLCDIHDPDNVYNNLTTKVFPYAFKKKDRAVFSSGLFELKAVLNDPHLSEAQKDDFKNNSILRGLIEKAVSNGIFSEEALQIALEIDPSALNEAS